MEIKPVIQEWAFNQILHYTIEYVDGTTVRFPYCKHGLEDAQLFVAMKTVLHQI